ncbi:amidohydrolase [Viridibacillus arvi]|uniref:amidohydrolase n=1 Tax=Viridibacillus arvi TaxID=263475 RepID=UPI003D05F10D
MKTMKTMTKVSLVALLLLLAVVGYLAYSYFKVPAQHEKEAFINAKIFTVDSKQSWAEAMVIEGDNIIYVGSSTGAEEYIDKNTKVHNLKGKMVLPGFVDSHAHPTMAAALSDILQLDLGMKKADILEIIKKHADKNKDLPVITAMGFDLSFFGKDEPTAADLDQIDRERPIVILDEGGHTAWVNSKAMEVGGINKDTPDPIPGAHYFVRDSNGNPTGLLMESQTFNPLLKKLSVVTKESIVSGGESLFPVFSQLGITTVYDAGMMGFENEGFKGLSQLEKEGLLPLRVSGSYMVQTPAVVPTAVESLKKLHDKYDSELIDVDTMKIHYDGTIEGKTAAMEQPYSDGSNGHVLFPVDEFKSFLTQIDEAGFNTHVHAIGDKALNNALEVFEYLQSTKGNTPTRKSIGHVQVYSDQAVERLSDLKDVVVQTTPIWATPSESTLNTLGKERYEKQLLMNSVDRAGVRLSFGSDFPASSFFVGANPFNNMAVGLTRQDVWSENKDVLAPIDEKISLETLIKGYTINGAYQLGLEEKIGSIEVGKKADFIVLEDNLFELTPEELLKAKILKTYMNGNVVFERGLKARLTEYMLF